MVKSLRETQPDAGSASGPLEDQAYDDGRSHCATTTAADASSAARLALDFESVIVMLGSKVGWLKGRCRFLGVSGKELRRKMLGIYIVPGTAMRSHLVGARAGSGASLSLKALY
jgi:hypothetical protein